MGEGDNWKHRSKEMICKTCMFFKRKEPTVLGRCRRHAPTMGGFPAVYETDHCGDHKLDEATVPHVGVELDEREIFIKELQKINRRLLADAEQAKHKQKFDGKSKKTPWTEESVFPGRLYFVCKGANYGDIVRVGVGGMSIEAKRGKYELASDNS